MYISDTIDHRVKSEEIAAYHSGYVRDPNTWDRWYAGSPNLPSLPNCMEVRIEDGKQTSTIQDSWPVAVYGHKYGGGLFLMSRFETWGKFISYVKDMGTVSPNPNTVYCNAWD